MGIAVHEILTMEYCREFEVIAGRGGLSREIQGVTMLESPDGYNWTKGNELVLSSGYIIHAEPDCLQRAFEQGRVQKTSGLAIKKDQYISSISPEIIQLFDKYEIPLILLPYSVSWMDLMNQINVAVLNQTIRRFEVHSGNEFQMSNLSYKEQKIKSILQNVEVDMHFPAALFDVAAGKTYYSSDNFPKITESFDLEDSDYWNPSKPYTKHTLCDYTNMVRYRLLNPKGIEGPRISWIIIPIFSDGILQAYFVVMESRVFIEYYDQYSIRIAYLLLKSLYEQVALVQNIGNLGFENFIHYVLSYEDSDKTKLISQAAALGFSMTNEYSCIMFRTADPKVSLRGARKQISEIFALMKDSRSGKVAILDDREGIVIFDRTEVKQYDAKQRKANIRKFQEMLIQRNPDLLLDFAVNNDMKNMSELKSSMEKCRHVMEVGQKIFPNDHIWDSEVLGPLLWIQIPDAELEELLAVYRQLMVDEKSRDLLRTLKVYLESNMNFSITAEKMYVHINTVRKRMDKINSLLQIDWDNHIERVKTYLLLQYLEL